jgi:2-iminobutanoate/2-iminopropanoate deaminase
MPARRTLGARPDEGPRPFSRGIAFDVGEATFIQISGAASTDGAGATLHVGDAEAQARRVFEVIGERLAEAGATLADIVKVLVFVRDIADYPAVNRVRLELFPNDPPASSAVEARMIRDDFLVEIEALAVIDRRRGDDLSGR